MVLVFMVNLAKDNSFFIEMDRLGAAINESDLEVVDIKFSSAAELSNGRSHSKFAALLLI